VSFQASLHAAELSADPYKNCNPATKEFDELLFEYGLELDEDVSCCVYTSSKALLTHLSSVDSLGSESPCKRASSTQD
jgi:hypothetical protein